MTTQFAACSRCGRPAQPAYTGGTAEFITGHCSCNPPLRADDPRTIETVLGDARARRDAELARLRAELEQNKAATERALELAVQYGGIDGDHHKAWVIDQMVRALLVTEPVYAQFVKDACDGEDGPDTYAWDTGVIP